MGWLKRIKDLDSVVNIQSSDGNWNYDPYMMGMANGLLLAQHIMTNELPGSMPEYKSAPSRWLVDASHTDLTMDKVARIVKKNKKESQDILPGGAADSMDDSKFDARQLEMGIKHELEHTTNTQLAKEIAKDHLVEDPQYYSHLSV